MKSTIYYEIKKVLKNNLFKIDNVDSKKIIKDIDLISRSILELGISDKDNVVIMNYNNVKFLELIYAFNKVGIKINIINDILDDRIYEADYLFLNEVLDLDIDNYKRIILYSNIDSNDDIVINWDKFYSISKYYNKEIINYNCFSINYVENNVLISLKDEDIINSVEEIDSRLGVKDSNVCVKYIDFILSNYLI